MWLNFKKIFKAFECFILHYFQRITMEHVQNATLAGGVAMGTAANMSVEPYGALINGFVAGALSTVGYAYIKVQFFV